MKDNSRKKKPTGQKGGPDEVAYLDPFIGTAEAARILKVGQVRVQQFAKQERLRGCLRSGRWYFRREDVMELAKLERPPGRPPKDT